MKDLPFINAGPIPDFFFLSLVQRGEKKSIGVTENKPDSEALGKPLKAAGFNITASPGL